MITSVDAFLRPIMPILQKVRCKLAPFRVIGLLAKDLLEIEVFREICRFRTWIGRVAHQVEIFGTSQRFLRTHSKASRGDLEQVDSVDAEWAGLSCALALDVSHVS